MGNPPEQPGWLAAERKTVREGAAAECDKTCDDGCHGDLACVRAEHPHRPAAADPDTGEWVDADISPHWAIDAGGQLVQWVCLPGDHDGLTDEQRHLRRAAAAHDARQAATQTLLAQVDPEVLAQRLAPWLAPHLTKGPQDAA